MKSTHDLLGRLRNIMPAGVQPKFTSSQEFMALAAGRRPEAYRRAGKKNQRALTENIFGRSGICDLHKGDTFSKYKVTNDGQKHALTMAKNYAHNFGSGFTSLIFCGSYGSVKNHLGSAISNYLLQRDHSVLVVTVPDLMLRARKCYDEGQSESELAG
ncbi:hypothetical protein L1887_44950 [Cichorium endivia]|nr:hypothetical protein L1887_44950 [Cichorium endivia]